MLRSNRRSFLKAALAPMLLGAEVSPLRGAQGPPFSPTFIATWKQGLPAVNRTAEARGPMPHPFQPARGD